MFYVIYLLIAAVTVSLIFIEVRKVKKRQLFLPPESAFLIRNKVDEKFIQQIHELFKDRKQNLAFEKLYKGGEEALVIFAPRLVVDFFPQLKLLELEDYLKTNDCVNAFNLTVKKNLNFFSNLELLQLTPSEKFFCQVVLEPAKNSQLKFNANLRVLIITQDANRGKGLKKELEELFLKMGLESQDRLIDSAKILDQYKVRRLTEPKFSLNFKEIENFLVN